MVIDESVDMFRGLSRKYSSETNANNYQRPRNKLEARTSQNFEAKKDVKSSGTRGCRF